MQTLLLDLTNCDLVVDSAGNIAVASAPYAIAQDVASACKLFLGELWYDTSKGIPYFEKVLGQLPSIDQLKEYLVSAALTVPGVVSATCIIQSFADRQVTGQIQFTDSTGNTGTVSL